MDDVISPTNSKLERLKLNKQSGYNYRERRQEDWLENYTLYRDRVVINRLTQRQSVNIPLMKTVIKTLLKDVDDMPVLFFQELDNDEEKQAFINEYWKYTIGPECNNMEIKDVVDKKQVMLFGRTFDSMQIVDGRVGMFIEDPEDMLVDRYMDPTNIDSSSFLIHTHIYMSLTRMENNDMFDDEAVKRLKLYFATEQGLIKSADNARSLAEKNRKMADMGLQDVDSPVLGETIVELSLHFNYDLRDGETEHELFLTIEAEDMEVLSDKALAGEKGVIGDTEDDYWKTHYPYNTWSDDVERQDFWNDGIADNVRTINKIANAWFSQEVENRTLHNLGMHFYDSTKEGFNPQTFQPIGFGMYPVPGKPTDVMQRVDVEPLQGNLDAINFIVGVAEKVSGATATQQGAQTERKITLGEVELALGEAKERVKGMSKFYTNAWYQRGIKFLKMLEAAGDKLDAVKLYKKGRNTDKLYPREVGPEDWKSSAGYACKVWSQDEKNTQDTKSLEKLNALKSVMQDNPKLDEIYKRKLAEFADLTPDETNEIMEYEKKKMEALNNPIGMDPNNPMGGGMGGPGMPPPGAPPPGGMGGGGPQIGQPLPPQPVG